MSSDESSDGYTPRYEDLERIEALDFSEKRQRRISALLLEEFVRITLYENGMTYLGLHDGSENNDLGTLWGNTLAQLKAMDGFEVPEAYDESMGELKHYRSKTSHVNVFDPPGRRLDELVEMYFEWGEWLVTVSEEYYESDIDPTPQEALLQIARENLYPLTSADSSYWYSEEQIKELKEQAIQVESKIEHMIDEEDIVTTELVNEISTAISLKSSYEDLVEQDNEVAEQIHRDLRVSSHIEEQRINERLE